MVEPRALRPVPDPLGSYLRPSRRDHKLLLQMLGDGHNIGTGLVANPCLADLQGDLLQEARSRGVETVLDPCTIELSTPGGFGRSGIADLPWAADRPHCPMDLQGAKGSSMVEQIVDAIEGGKHTAVLAPTHYLGEEGNGWSDVDLELTHKLRRELDARQLRDVPIYYPLALHSKGLLNGATRAAAMTTLAKAPIDAIWLRVHPFGTNSSGSLALRRYLEVCRSLHVLGKPLVADHSGTVGVALLYFGAVGGIESGVTVGEGVDLSGYLTAPKAGGRGFLRPARIYLQRIGAFLETRDGSTFFAARGMKPAHGCQEACCPRGWQDMQLHPARHFVTRRAREVAAASAMPPNLRPGFYMETFLRPASDSAVRAAEAFAPLETVRKRLDSWRGTLGADLEQHSAFTISEPASGKRLRRSA